LKEVNLIKPLNSKEVIMIKIKNAKHSNLFFGTVMFLGFLLMWGCTKNVAPPEVEEPPAPVVEAIPESEPGSELDLTQEEAGIQESEETGFSGGIETSGPDAIDEVDVVEVVPEQEPETIPEFASENELEPVQEFASEQPVEEQFEQPVEEVVEEAPPVMSMQDDVFVAPGAEPVQEARVLPDFKDEQQLQDVHFEYDRDKLDTSTKTILEANADWLKKNPNARVEIQGHADERGTNNYNLGLGERRALQTKKYLINLGIDESRLYTISYGEEKPFCFDSNENCWWENRRAHFTVAD
jgi:peptidoglycan-associated lipoprotein